jgi:type I restriction enzyme R subunit
VLPDAFPGRSEVPKTLIFAKDDTHADDIVRIAREVFAEGNDFCQKITYRTGFTKITKTVKNDDGTESEVSEWVKTSSLSPDEILANFRNSFYPRIAVTVDMISTGTDVKPIECVFFMRNVKSAGFFEQMKGRGVRVISPDKLRTVTPSARVKDRFIIVDAVGVCEEDKTDSKTLNRQPSATLEQLLNYVSQGGTDADALTTLAGRLARLQRDFSAEQLGELKELAGGKSFADLAHDLLHACDPDAQAEAARAIAGGAEPTEAQVKQAAEQLAQAAVTPFLKAQFRRRILEIRQQNEQTIDRHTIDDVLYAGFDAAAVEKAAAKVKNFRAWIAEHKDELTALQGLYAGTRPLKLSLKELRQLRDALARPPLAATPEQLWRAFQAVEAEKVKGTGGEVLTDLVALVRHALMPAMTLVPYREELRERYRQWLNERDADKAFTPEQREWLDRMAEHIATSLAIAPEDFEAGWFGQHGSLGRAHALFGDKLKPLMTELNERLAA